MKKKLLHLLIVFLGITAYADNAIIRTECCDLNDSIFFGCNDDDKCDHHHSDEKQCCPKRGKRGRRGERGPRGRRGPQGENAPILLTEEFFVNAPQITNSTGDTPDTSFIATYGIPTVLEAWSMPFPQPTSNPAFGTQFLIPINLDRTQPVSLTMHFFNPIGEGTGDIRLQIQADYMQTAEIIGISFPATGYDETFQTGNLPVINPVGADNLRYFTVTVSLNPALMVNKTWAVVVLTRIFTTNDNDFPGPIFLTGLSVRYTRLTE